MIYNILRSVKVITKATTLLLFLLTLSLGGLLSMGIIPAASELAARSTRWGIHAEWGVLLAFPALTFIFWITVFLREGWGQRTDSYRKLLEMSALPFLIALIYGAVANSTKPDQYDLLWYCLSVPIGEELLFRGWFYAVVNRLAGHRFISLTNPLPAAVFFSSLGFSLWHLQNLETMSWLQVAFQLVYTFFAGLWLGYLRWKTGKIVFPLAAHIGLNAMVM